MNSRNSTAVEPYRGPEYHELAKLTAEIDRLTERLAQTELELATLSGELQTFRRRYMRRLGALEVALLRLEEKLFAAQVEQGDAESKQKAEEASERAERVEREVDEAEDSGSQTRFEPSAELKSLYREAAKALHPDLAVNDDDREARTKAMAQLNDAYRAEDGEEIERIWAAWKASSDVIEGQSVDMRLERARWQVEHLSARMRESAEAVGALRALPVYELMLRVRLAEDEGVEDAFLEIEAELKAEIARTERLLERVADGS